ncbi:hypothetical protein [Actinoplanes sp. CA-252034]|uniref:hypothetical protein n=1 Tax=Actinoplanes sp. CA-252034 TaxID=3239906 RepID=UPI003D96A544
MPSSQVRASDSAALLEPITPRGGVTAAHRPGGVAAAHRPGGATAAHGTDGGTAAHPNDGETAAYRTEGGTAAHPTGEATAARRIDGVAMSYPAGGAVVSGGALAVTVRHAAVDAPILLLAYGLLRLIDGLGGPYPRGLAWDLAHLALFAAMVLFGVLAVAVRPLVPSGAHWLAALAAAMTVAGTACVLWGAAGLLAPEFGAASPLPEPLRIAGPLLFALGMLTLLGLLVAARSAPAWSPLLFGAGIAAMIIDADLLLPAAIILLAALAPLARPRSGGR